VRTLNPTKWSYIIRNFTLGNLKHNTIRVITLSRMRRAGHVHGR
jgi:hypothetical protein